MTVAGVALYCTVAPASLLAFYAVCTALGCATGYWAVFVTIASEQFGNSVRATATTSAPNFVRGAVVLLTSAFQAATPALGVVGSGVAVGAAAIAVAFASLAALDETFAKDLDFLEECPAAGAYRRPMSARRLRAQPCFVQARTVGKPSYRPANSLFFAK